MATPTTIHGDLPDSIRDHHGVFGAKADQSPQSQLARARAQVAKLTQRKNEADRRLREGVEANDGRIDLNEAARTVKQLARELEEATEQSEQWASVVEQTEKAERERKFNEIVARGKELREEFRDRYRDAALLLGEWYSLGCEARELYNALGDRLPQGSVYYRPELTEGRATFDVNPDPRTELKQEYSEIYTFQSWKRELALIPLAEKEK